MSSELKEIQVEGIVSRTREQYTITTDDGTNFGLSAILPWESVAPDYGTGVFAPVRWKTSKCYRVDRWAHHLESSIDRYGLKIILSLENFLFF